MATNRASHLSRIHPAAPASNSIQLKYETGHKINCPSFCSAKFFSKSRMRELVSVSSVCWDESLKFRASELIKGDDGANKGSLALMRLCLWRNWNFGHIDCCGSSRCLGCCSWVCFVWVGCCSSSAAHLFPTFWTYIGEFFKSQVTSAFPPPNNGEDC